MTDPKTPPDALTADEERARAALVDDLGVLLHSLRLRHQTHPTNAYEDKLIQPDPARVRTILAGPLGVVARSTTGRLDDLRTRQRAERFPKYEAKP